MRTALLLAQKRTDSGQLRAFLPLLGRSVLAWQVEFMRELDCERFIVMCEAPTPEILGLQREVEEAGGEFHALRGNLQLVALLRADDQVILMLDGLVVGADTISFLPSPTGGISPHILVLPPDHPFAREKPEDFERLDATRHWAGIAAIPAATTHKLSEMPPDSDVTSLLLRLALQAKVPCKSMGTTHDESVDLVLADADGALASYGNALIKKSAPTLIWSAPFSALAHLATHRLAPLGLSDGFAISLGSMTFMTLCALAFAWFGLGPAALGALGLAAFAASLASGWADLRARLFKAPSRAKLLQSLSILVDVAAVVALLLILSEETTAYPLMALPLFTLGLFRLASDDPNERIRAFWSDRSLHLIGFAIASLFSMLTPALIVSGLGALASKLLRDVKN